MRQWPPWQARVVLRRATRSIKDGEEEYLCIYAATHFLYQAPTFSEVMVAQFPCIELEGVGKELLSY
jgi:hypothetical protein